MNNARFVVGENGRIVRVEVGTDDENALIDADLQEEYELRWRLQHEVDLKTHIDRYLYNCFCFNMPLGQDISTLNCFVKNPSVGWQQLIEIEHTTFASLLDFLVYYGYIIRYPLVYPRKKPRKRWVGK